MKFLIFAFVACLSFPAFAGNNDNTITIIHDDGSKDVIELGRPAAPAPPPEPVEAPVSVSEDAAQSVEEVATPPVPEAAETIEAPVAPADVATTSPKAAKKPPPKKAPVKKAPPPPPAPPKIVKPPPLPVQREIQAGGVSITRGKAISIALAYAPPSSDVEVFQSAFEGQPVFAVVFETEDGFHEVLVHSQTGKVLESRESNDFNRQSAPGHLPRDLR